MENLTNVVVEKLDGVLDFNEAELEYVGLNDEGDQQFKIYAHGESYDLYFSNGDSNEVELVAPDSNDGVYFGWENIKNFLK